MAKEKTKTKADEAAEMILEQIRMGTAPWQRSWTPGTIHLNHNAATGANYKGYNQTLLMQYQDMAGYLDPRWLTYRQAQEAGTQVKGGESGWPLMKFTFEDRKKKITAEEAAKIHRISGWDGEGFGLGSRGRVATIRKMPDGTIILSKKKGIASGFTVFNAQQIEGMPPLSIGVHEPKARNERCDQLIRASGARFNEQAVIKGSPCYIPILDEIRMPLISQFKTPEAFYGTALHELSHWTGHESRLNRDLANPFGTEEYAKEEIRAEMSAFILAGELGLGHEARQSAAYIETWLKAVENDKTELYRATNDVNRISHFVMQFDPQRQLEQAPEQAKLPIEVAQAHAQVVQAADGTDKNFFEERVKEYEVAARDAATDMGASPTDADAALSDVAAQVQEQQVQMDQRAELAGLVGPVQYAAFGGAQPREMPANDRYKMQVLKNAADRHLTGAEMVKVREILQRGEAQRDWGAQALAAFYTARAVEMEREQLASPLTDKELRDERDRLIINTELERGRLMPQQQLKSERIYLTNLPFKEKDQAAALGAIFDRYATPKMWYIPPGGEVEAFAKWLGPKQVQVRGDQVPMEQRIYLFVPKSEKDEAKKLGAWYDTKDHIGQWYAPTPEVAEKCAKWRVQAQALDPVAEFAKACEKKGLLLPGAPIADGKWHRVPVMRDAPKPGDEAGAYRLFLDGRPAGSIQNFYAGEDKATVWTMQGPQMAPADAARLHQGREQRVAKQEQMQAAEQKANQARLAILVAGFPAAGADHPYLQKKGIETAPENALVRQHEFQGKPQQLLVLPLRHVATGEITGWQNITATGYKWFERGTGKEGGAFIVGKARAGQPLLIAEGMATSASVAKATGMQVYSAFTSGNMKSVATALRAKYPDRPIVILGDNDWAKALKINPATGKPFQNDGKVKAEKIAEEVPGVAVILVPNTGVAAITDWNDYMSMAKVRGEEKICADYIQAAVARATQQVEVALGVEAPDQKMTELLSQKEERVLIKEAYVPTEKRGKIGAI